jgi:hypothetical protein
LGKRLGDREDFFWLAGGVVDDDRGGGIAGVAKLHPLRRYRLQDRIAGQEGD